MTDLPAIDDILNELQWFDLQSDDGTIDTGFARKQRTKTALKKFYAEELLGLIKKLHHPSPSEWLKLKAELKKLVGSETYNDLPYTYIDGCIDGSVHTIHQMEQTIKNWLAGDE